MSRFHTVSTNSALLSPFPRHFRSPSLLSRRLPLFSRALWIVCLRWHLRLVLAVVAAVVVVAMGIVVGFCHCCRHKYRCRIFDSIGPYIDAFIFDVAELRGEGQMSKKDSCVRLTFRKLLSRPTPDPAPPCEQRCGSARF